jgi:hypothetical protein
MDHVNINHFDAVDNPYCMLIKIKHAGLSCRKPWEHEIRCVAVE